ncbi:hypothetical protein GCM10012275_46670 [Longimycelium tulufanense]|uniref:Uncharacterized protein n=2 Tax=Longimycelium tulufanense TaxID=907463 RepID=A0A8J3CBR4_9PSEU|nr:hypothetical protein GCM10012275_46670 [Longimycelium tulufanense]
MRYARSGGTDVAALPPLAFQSLAESDPRRLLLSLAERASRQPPPSGTGPYFYSRSRRWSIVTDQHVVFGTMGAGVDQLVEETWIARDGTGRMVRTPEGDDPRSPHMDVPVGSGPTRTPDATYHPDPSADDSMWDQPAEQLQARITREGAGRTTAQWFESATSLWERQAHTPALGAAIPRVLADQPEIRVEGATTDRAGRRGVAVSTMARDPRNGYAEVRRLYLVFHPETGFLTAVENVALDGLHVPVDPPATVHYTLWLDGGYVPDTETRP